MRLILIIAFPFVFNPTKILGQINAFTAKDHVVIKFSPLPLFDADNTVQFGIEFPFGKSNFTVQQDLGYGHSSFSIWYTEYNNPPNKDIYKSRTQLRYYYFEKRKVRGYFGGEFLFKKVVYRNNEWVGMDCSGFGGCGYFEQKQVRISRVVAAGHTRLGWQLYFSSRLTLDLFTGFGLRSIAVKPANLGIPSEFVPRPREVWANTTPGSHDYVPSLVLGFHFGIVLGGFDD